MYIEFLDYTLNIHTGETIKISEISCFNNPDFDIEIFKSGPDNLSHLVSLIPVPILEEAKIGYTSNFVNLLKTPPKSAFRRLGTLKCYERRECASYKPNLCTLREHDRRERIEFPRCWVFDTKHEEHRMIWTSITMKWREGNYVIISY